MKNEDKQFLSTASSIDIVIANQNGRGPFSSMSEHAVFEWLRENRQEAYFVVLGCHYDIAVYQVEGEGVTAGCPPHEIGKWFAATHSGDFEDAPNIPVQDTLEICYAVTCELLGLEKLYQAEHAAGTALPRTCHGESTSITDLIAHIVREVRELEKLDCSELFMKLSEENGEFSEAILIERGKLPGKVLKEPAMGESADILIGTVCVLAKHYPDMSPDEIATNLAKWCNIKMRKYSKKLRS